MTSDVSPWHPMYIWHTIDIGVIRHWNGINAIMSRIPISSFFLLVLIAINNIYFCQLMWCWNNISQIKKKALWLAVISYMHKIVNLFENIRCATAFLKNNICTYICIPFLFFTAATYFLVFLHTISVEHFLIRFYEQCDDVAKSVAKWLEGIQLHIIIISYHIIIQHTYFIL